VDPAAKIAAKGLPSWAFIEGEELSVIEGRVNARGCLYKIDHYVTCLTAQF
jgi:hypothetical protein